MIASILAILTGTSEMQKDPRRLGNIPAELGGLCEGKDGFRAFFPNIYDE
jgi:hypothetical protein